METIKYIDRKTGELLTENPPGEGALKFLYYNPFGRLALSAVVKRKIISALYGRMMSKASSRKKIQPFVDRFRINMDDAIKKVAEFESFNDFFYRKLKPEARPIGQGVVSPGDGKVIAFESVGDIQDFFVKGERFTLERFLNNKDLAAQFKDSSLFIIRLAPNDYHRFHFPYDGQVSDVTTINGAYFSVSPYALQVGFTRVFCENKREYTTLQTEDKGTILLAPVGATMVGTIIETFEPNSQVQKGDEMGYFAFGGSSVLMLVDKNKIKIDADILENTKKGMETSILMGEQIGV